MLLRLYIDLYIEKQHVFLLRSGDLHSISNLFDLKSINGEFLLFFKLLKKHPIQYFTIEL